MAREGEAQPGGRIRGGAERSGLVGLRAGDGARRAVVKRSRVYWEQRARCSANARLQQRPRRPCSAPFPRAVPQSRCSVPAAGSPRGRACAARTRVGPPMGAPGGSTPGPGLLSSLEDSRIWVHLVAPAALERSEGCWEHPETGRLRCAGWECCPCIAGARGWCEGRPMGRGPIRRGFQEVLEGSQVFQPEGLSPLRAVVHMEANERCCTQPAFAYAVPRGPKREGGRRRLRAGTEVQKHEAQVLVGRRRGRYEEQQPNRSLAPARASRCLHCISFGSRGGFFVGQRTVCASPAGGHRLSDLPARAFQGAGIPFCHSATRKGGSGVWSKAKRLAYCRGFCGAKSRCKPSRENVR